jgi:hypothetical protein
MKKIEQQAGKLKRKVQDRTRSVNRRVMAEMEEARPAEERTAGLDRWLIGDVGTDAADARLIRSRLFVRIRLEASWSISFAGHAKSGTLGART